MAEKLDIFRVLNAANDKQREFYDELTEDERKAMQPVLVMRWMSGTQNPLQLLLINECLNQYVFPLYRDKQLLWNLLVASNVGKKQRYTWNKLPAKVDPSRPTCVKVLQQYYHYSTKEAIQALRLLTREDVLILAEALGYQQEDISKIKKEIKGSSSDDDEAPKKTKKNKVAEDLFEF